MPNAHDGRHAPATAQLAIRQGGLMATNLPRALRGQATMKFSQRPLGSMASIGYMKGVATLIGLPLTGLPAWLLWRAYYLSPMPRLRRKVRIFLEWTWGIVFPTDITHRHFPGSQTLRQTEHEDCERAAGDVAVSQAG